MEGRPTPAFEIVMRVSAQARRPLGRRSVAASHIDSRLII